MSEYVVNLDVYFVAETAAEVDDFVSNLKQVVVSMLQKCTGVNLETPEEL